MHPHRCSRIPMKGKGQAVWGAKEPRQTAGFFICSPAPLRRPVWRSSGPSGRGTSLTTPSRSALAAGTPPTSESTETSTSPSLTGVPASMTETTVPFSTACCETSSADTIYTGSHKCCQHQADFHRVSHDVPPCVVKFTYRYIIFYHFICLLA